MLEKIQTILAHFEVDKALAFLQEHGERKGTIKSLTKSRNVASIRYEIELMLRNPKLYEQDTSQAKAYATEVRAYPVEKRSLSAGASPTAEVRETDEYPDNYPAILCEKLREARRLIAEKKRISNTLYLQPKQNKKHEVDRIVELADMIDEIYEVKKRFDVTKRLPVEWLAPSATQTEKDSADIQEVLNQIKNINSNISKTNAKLRNPAECTPKKSRQWHAKLREWELERARLKSIIGM